METVYMMGIGGIAMGTLAAMLVEKGYRVAGSDQNRLYPPMSTFLESLRIPVCTGYDAANPGRFAPDVVVIGNVIRRENPEAQFVLEHGIPYLSMPEAIERFFLGERRSIVVAGTHGKSTTSSLLAWVLSHAGLEPAAFIGAFVNNWQRSYRLGSGPYMVIEGDEYDTAFFDKGPKFLHYRPHIGILTSVEFDHADIFADFAAVVEAFRRFVRLIPPEGALIVNADDPVCMELSRECGARVITYGRASGADWRLLDITYETGGLRFHYSNSSSPRAETMVSKLAGEHNVGNSLAVLAACSLAGLERGAIQSGLLAFQGLKRRQEVVGKVGGVLVVDDFAHHPTAVRETVRALRLFYPHRRIVAAFEPRTNSSRRSVFQQAYAEVFDDADCICVKQPPGMEAIAEGERLDTRKLVREIGRRGREAFFFETAEELLEFLLSRCTPGDLVLCMSNGSFDGVPTRLIEALEGRHSAR